MNYRNKTIFGWKDFQLNEISSVISLNVMQIFKSHFDHLDIHNVIIRDVEKQIGIIFQINKIEFNKVKGIYIYNLVTEIINSLNYNLKLFGIQYLSNKRFIKGKNIIYYKKEFIEFNVNYIDSKKICLLPDSFYQANISVLNHFYENFYKWIIESKCSNIINLGDDGGNVCTILSSLFDKKMSFFHCPSSFECARKMTELNEIVNFNISFNLDDVNSFEKENDNIILFINPGRKGLKKEEIDFIKHSKINYIIYMACNQKAFIKDLNLIKKYKIKEMTDILNMPVINKYQYLYFLYSDIDYN